MEKFKVYADGNKDFFVITDNYVFAEDMAKEHARGGHTVTIEHDGRITAYFSGVYEIFSCANGWSIRKKGKYNRYEYLKSLYKGKAVFCSDFTHEKHYTTLKAAKQAIEKINS